MQAIFLGTNGWYDTGTGNTICTFLRSREFNIIFDAGTGLHKLDDHIDYSKDTFLFLSHFHLDHIIGLHILNKFHFRKRFAVIGPKGMRRTLDRLVARPFTIPFCSLAYDIEFIELGEGAGNVGFELEFLPLFHSEPTLGYRIGLEGCTVSHCLDTGPCSNIVKLSRNSDLMIAECSFPSGMYVRGWPHLNPELAARAAKKARTKRLAMTHYDASIYRTAKDRLRAQRIARRIFPSTLAATDGMKITV